MALADTLFIIMALADALYAVEDHSCIAESSHHPEDARHIQSFMTRSWKRHLAGDVLDVWTEKLLMDLRKPPGAPECLADAGAVKYMEKLYDDPHSLEHRSCEGNKQNCEPDWLQHKPPLCETVSNFERVGSIKGVLRAVKTFMQRAGVSFNFWYIADGTLLGQRKCEDVLPWDGDGDVGVHFDVVPDLKTLLSSEGKQNGQNIVRSHGRFGPFLLTWKDLKGTCNLPTLPLVVIDLKTGFYVDLKVFTPLPDNYTNVYRHHGETPAGGKTYFPTASCMIFDEDFPCPADREASLTLAYGEDWRTSTTSKHSWEFPHPNVPSTEIVAATSDSTGTSTNNQTEKQSPLLPLGGRKSETRDSKIVRHSKNQIFRHSQTFKDTQTLQKAKLPGGVSGGQSPKSGSTIIRVATALLGCWVLHFAFAALDTHSIP